MEAETDSSKETTKTDQKVIKLLPLQKSSKGKTIKQTSLKHMRCGCSKTYVSQSKMQKHILERHSNIFIEIVKYESYKRTTYEYVKSRKKVTCKFIPSLNKSSPKATEIEASDNQSSDDEESFEGQLLLELIAEVSRFLEQLREIDTNTNPYPTLDAFGMSKFQAKNLPNLIFGQPKQEPKAMLLENFTGQSKAKVAKNIIH
jgi:hypothetical protein